MANAPTITAAIQSGGRAASATIESEHDRRQGDAGFDGWERNAKDAEPAAGGHDQGKDDRQQPDRRCAKERAPKADRHHGDNMVDAKDRMGKAARKAAGKAFAGVGQRRFGQSGSGQGKDKHWSQAATMINHGEISQTARIRILFRHDGNVS